MPQTLLAMHALMTTLHCTTHALRLPSGCLILFKRASLLLVPSLKIALCLCIAHLTLSWPSWIKDTVKLEAGLIGHLAEAPLLHRT